jgi:hypothetical protein
MTDGGESCVVLAQLESARLYSLLERWAYPVKSHAAGVWFFTFRCRPPPPRCSLTLPEMEACGGFPRDPNLISALLTREKRWRTTYADTECG